VAATGGPAGGQGALTATGGVPAASDGVLTVIDGVLAVTEGVPIATVLTVCDGVPTMREGTLTGAAGTAGVEGPCADEAWPRAAGDSVVGATVVCAAGGGDGTDLDETGSDDTRSGRAAVGAVAR
jgi:hypothetical protein